MPTDVAAKELAQLIDGEIRVMGFDKKGKKWTRTTNETVCHLVLSKVRWRQTQYYLEVYRSIMAINTATAGEEPVWHIFGSGFSPDVQEKVEWEKCLNRGHAVVSGHHRQGRLVEILQQKIVPWLRAFETFDGVKALLLSGQLRGMGIRTEVQNFTGYHV